MRRSMTGNSRMPSDYNKKKFKLAGQIWTMLKGQGQKLFWTGAWSERRGARYYRDNRPHNITFKQGMQIATNYNVFASIPTYTYLNLNQLVSSVNVVAHVHVWTLVNTVLPGNYCVKIVELYIYLCTSKYCLQLNAQLTCSTVRTTMLNLDIMEPYATLTITSKYVLSSVDSRSYARL